MARSSRRRNPSSGPGLAGERSASAAPALLPAYRHLESSHRQRSRIFAQSGIGSRARAWTKPLVGAGDRLRRRWRDQPLGSSRSLPRQLQRRRVAGARRAGLARLSQFGAGSRPWACDYCGRLPRSGLSHPIDRRYGNETLWNPAHTRPASYLAHQRAWARLRDRSREHDGRRAPQS